MLELNVVTFILHKVTWGSWNVKTTVAEINTFYISTE